MPPQSSFDELLRSRSAPPVRIPRPAPPAVEEPQATARPPTASAQTEFFQFLVWSADKRHPGRWTGFVEDEWNRLPTSLPHDPFSSIRDNRGPSREFDSAGEQLLRGASGGILERRVRSVRWLGVEQ